MHESDVLFEMTGCEECLGMITLAELVVVDQVFNLTVPIRPGQEYFTAESTDVAGRAVGRWIKGCVEA